MTTPLNNSSYISSLSRDECKETLRGASDECIKQLAKFLTQGQYEYSLLTLPSRKAKILQGAREALSNDPQEPVR